MEQNMLVNIEDDEAEHLEYYETDWYKKVQVYGDVDGNWSDFDFDKLVQSKIKEDGRSRLWKNHLYIVVSGWKRDNNYRTGKQDEQKHHV